MERRHRFMAAAHVCRPPPKQYYGNSLTLGIVSGVINLAKEIKGSGP
jgi:hypothetical protein